MAFETAALANINLKLEAISSDAGIMKQYQPQVAGIRQIITNQTAKVDARRTALADSDENRSKGSKVYVHWLTTSNIVEEAISENCTLTEPKLDSASQAANLTMEFRTGFSVDEDEMKESIYSVEELVARGLLKSLQVMDEGYAKRAIAKADALAGTNLFVGAFSNVAGHTVVPANKYNEALFPYLAKAAVINRLGSYYIIDGGELFEGKFLADMNRANGEGKGLANMYDQFNIEFDLTNFATSGVTSDSLLIDRNSLFFVTKNRFQNTVPQMKAGQYRYKIASRSLPGVFYDVYYKEECKVVNGKDHIVETFRLQTEGDLLKNPEITYPGVIAFEKGA